MKVNSRPDKIVLKKTRNAGRVDTSNLMQTMETVTLMDHNVISKMFFLTSTYYPDNMLLLGQHRVMGGMVGYGRRWQ